MRIPEYKQDVIVARPVANTVDLGQIQSAATQYEGISKGIGLGLEIADRFKKAEDTSQLNDMVISAEKQKHIMLDQTRANPDLEYSAFPDNFDKDLNKLDEDIIKNSNASETVKQLYRENAKKQNLSIFNDNLSWGRKQTVNKINTTIERNMQDLGDLAAAYTAAGKPLDELYKHHDATMALATQIYSSDDLAYMDKKGRAVIQEASLKTKVETNPEEALRETTFGKHAVGDITFDDAVAKVFEFEGGFVADDGGKGATIMGINSAANPEEFKKIQELYQAGKKSEARKIAEQVYKKKYWDAIGADKLDPKLAMVAFDAAVNQGVGAAKEMLAESGGDVGKMLELRQQRYDAIVKRDPSKAQYAEGWKRRLDELSGLAEGSDLPVDTIISMRDAAKKTIKEKEAAAKEAAKQVQQENISGFLDVVMSPDSTTAEKILAINKADLLGEIPDDFAAEARRYINAEQDVKAVTNADKMADVVTRMYDLNSISDINQKDYLIGINNLKKEILRAHNDGELSVDDKAKLFNQLKTLTSNKVATATQELSYSFGKANKVFTQTLPPEYRGEAIRQLFYETIGDEKPSKEYYEQRARIISDDIRKQKREVAVEAVNKPAVDIDAILKSKGYTRQDVQETAKKYNITEQEVIQKLMAK